VANYNAAYKPAAAKGKSTSVDSSDLRRFSGCRVQPLLSAFYRIYTTSRNTKLTRFIKVGCFVHNK
jgi:hypothetical protein